MNCSNSSPHTFVSRGILLGDGVDSVVGQVVEQGSAIGCGDVLQGDRRQGEPESGSYPQWRGTVCSPALPLIRRPAVGGKVWGDRADRGTPVGPAGVVKRKRSTRTAAKDPSRRRGLLRFQSAGERHAWSGIFPWPMTYLLRQGPLMTRREPFALILEATVTALRVVRHSPTVEGFSRL